MKLFLTVISSTFLFACNNIPEASTIQLPPENSKVQNIKLVDSLGDIIILLPTRYDTSFSWTHHSDCGKPCDRIKYRFQPKSLPITQESGWIWLDEPKDSIERFTISHSGYFPFYENTDSVFLLKLRQIHENRKEYIVQELGYKLKSDTIEKIGGRSFSIITVDFYDTTKTQYLKQLFATTTIKSNMIELMFELLTKQKDSLKDSFIENAKYYLRTVRISKGM